MMPPYSLGAKLPRYLDETSTMGTRPVFFLPGVVAFLGAAHVSLAGDDRMP
jgi:hypothetical protein